ncbi:MAG: T9SS type A sorting domain-containing protein [Rhodothermaceae bacterium]|nr:T9SS type A sorting domain-containing protein [Rhodothermaceae bacterium]
MRLLLVLLLLVPLPGLGQALPCHVAPACRPDAVPEEILSAVFRYGNATGYLVAGEDPGAAYFVTKRHGQPSASSVGDTTWTPLIFGQRQSTCGVLSEVAALPDTTVLSGAVVRAISEEGDRVLYALLQPRRLGSIRPYLLGHRLSETPSGVFLGHPQGQDLQLGLPEDWSVAYPDTLPGMQFGLLYAGQGAVETGMSGSPLIDAEGYVIGDVGRGGPVFGCDGPDDEPWFSVGVNLLITNWAPFEALLGMEQEGRVWGTAVASESPEYSPSGLRATAAPNPFYSHTDLVVTVPTVQRVNVAVFDVLGRRLAVLHNGLLVGPATHRFALDGVARSPGVYLVRVRGEQTVAVVRATRAD